jgi:hypothetical protein
MIADRGAIQHVHDLAIDVLQPVTGIDQHERPLEHGATAQEIVD